MIVSLLEKNKSLKGNIKKWKKENAYIKENLTADIKSGKMG